jgi:hypothetical protein
VAMCCCSEEDWQAQVEELVALQSIYGEAAFRRAPHCSCASLRLA